MFHCVSVIGLNLELKYFLLSYNSDTIKFHPLKI